MPHIFSSHMVLQRDRPVRIWGKAAAGEKIIVRLNGQTKETAADNNGDWALLLDAEKGGGPYQLVIASLQEKIVFDDVLVGEVWICSGQSNMEWTVANAMNAKNEIAAADYAQIRQFDVPNKIAFSPQWNTEAASWKVCSPNTAGTFSAVAYFFARKLYNELKIPVGLVNATWSGTVAEAWMSRDFLFLHPDFTNAVKTTPSNERTYSATIENRYRDMVEKFQGRPAAFSAAGWKEPDFKDSAWPLLRTDQIWEAQKLDVFDGTVWYRASIELSAAQVASDAVIHLGTIDDDDSVYINGIAVGATQLWNTARHYAIGKGILRQGPNVIAVQVVDHGGGGGFYGSMERSISFADGQKVLLPVSWRAQVVRSRVNINPNELLSSLYNGMVHPVTPFTIRGTIWYQGESNVDRAIQYETLFPLLIKNWRNDWQQGDFPFYFAQLSSYDPDHKSAGSVSSWAALREAQRKTLSVPNTGMAVTIDIGDSNDIHPRNKQDVGLRLALIALRDTYGREINASGPMAVSATEKGRSIKIRFHHAGSGLATKNNEPVGGFEIIDWKNKIYQVTGIVSGKEVFLGIPERVRPKTVRYGWKDNAQDANLMNADGLPAAPFMLEVDK